MITPHCLQTRSVTLRDACGGRPDRSVPETAQTAVAWDADQAIWYLVHARDAMRWLHDYRSRGADSLAHGYRTYHRKRRLARVCLTFALDRLAKAEAGYANLRAEATTGM